jgi:hypothetical protein
MFDEFLDKAAELRSRGESFAIVVVVRFEAPISGKPGDKAIIDAHGKIWGWIEGAVRNPSWSNSHQSFRQPGERHRRLHHGVPQRRNFGYLYRTGAAKAAASKFGPLGGGTDPCPARQGDPFRGLRRRS